LELTLARVEAERTEAFKNALATATDRIQDSLAKSFEHMGSILMGQDGDVENIDNVSVEVIDCSIIRLLDDDSAEVALTARVDFSADVQFGDEDASFHDKETGKTTYFNKISETWEQSIELTAKGHVWFEGKDLGMDIDIASSGPITVSKDDGWPYK
jgi:hypothetical protein